MSNWHKKGETYAEQHPEVVDEVFRRIWKELNEYTEAE